MRKIRQMKRIQCDTGKQGDKTGQNGLLQTIEPDRHKPRPGHARQKIKTHVWYQHDENVDEPAVNVAPQNSQRNQKPDVANVAIRRKRHR